MLIEKAIPTGVDFHIQRLQTQLYWALVGAAIRLDPDDYKAYGRCYRNKTENGYIAENYEGGNEYKEVYWDDALSVISFFGMGSISRVSIMNQADIHFVVFADLKKLYPGITHRADEELRGLVQSLIGKYGNGFEFVSTETGLENVLREYPGSRRDDRLKFVDTHPVHCFRINLKLNYKANKSC